MSKHVKLLNELEDRKKLLIAAIAALDPFHQSERLVQETLDEIDSFLDEIKSLCNKLTTNGGTHEFV